jgi:hypothetical protein
MVADMDSGVSTRVNEGEPIQSAPSVLEERRWPKRLYSLPAVVALVFSVPSSANVQITEPLISVNQTYSKMGWVSRKEHDWPGAELYAPFPAVNWGETRLLRIPITRYLRAKVVSWGPLKLLPVKDDI